MIAPTNRNTAIIVIGAIVGIIVVGSIDRGQPANPDNLIVNAVAADASPDTDAALSKAEDERKGFHCLSSWDGSNRSVVKLVKENLRNPASFEHADTQIGPETASGYHPLKMKYRAENGFGGMNVEEVVAAVDHKTCEATIITSVEQMNKLLP